MKNNGNIIYNGPNVVVENNENSSKPNNINFKISLNVVEKDDFEFIIYPSNTTFALTRNNSFYKDNVSTIISKIVIIKEPYSVNINQVSEALGIMKIKELNIFSIDKNSESNVINITSINKGSKIKYLEMTPESFIEFINMDNNNFLSYNSHSLYIVRDGNYIDIKNLFSKIDNCSVNLGRWRRSLLIYMYNSR